MALFGCLGGLHPRRRGLLRAALGGVAALASPGLIAAAQPEPGMNAGGRGERVIHTQKCNFPRPWLDLREDIADMDAQGVTIRAMSPGMPMGYEPGLSERMARIWNDRAALAHQRYPDRLYGLILLPMRDTDRALKELDRAKSLPGMCGVSMGTSIDNIDLSDRRFLPVFQAVEAAGLGVFLHPPRTGGGNPMDTAIAAVHLILGGVLDVCPGLEVNLPYAGDALPMLTKVPGDYLRRFTYSMEAHSADAMKRAISEIGIDRIMLGDRYGTGYECPVTFVDRLHLQPAERTMLLSGNAAGLLKL